MSLRLPPQWSVEHCVIIGCGPSPPCHARPVSFNAFCSAARHSWQEVSRPAFDNELGSLGRARLDNFQCKPGFPPCLRLEDAAPGRPWLFRPAVTFALTVDEGLEIA